MKDLLLIFDSVRYDLFNQVHSGEGTLYKAYSHGTWTRPSIASILSGYLPTSDYGQPYKPSWVMCSPQMFHDQPIPAWFLNANAWVKNMQPRNYVEKEHLQPHSAPLMMEEAEKIMNSHKRFFVAMLLVETHVPYNHTSKIDGKARGQLIKKYNLGEDNDAPLLARKWQKEAITYLLKLSKPLLNLADRTFYTSDHADLMGDGLHLIGHDPTYPFHIKLLEVPLVVVL